VPPVKGVLKAVIGLGGPLLLLILVFQAISWRPDAAPEPAALDTETPEGTGVQLVGSPDGRWAIADDGESFLGYRVVEHYPQLRSPSEGVGRTTDVEGHLVVEDRTLVEVEVVGDLRGLVSGHQNRDRAVQSRYLDTDEHPEAVFVLTDPVPFDDRLRPGLPFSVEADGTLTVREVEQAVTFPLEVRWDGDVVHVAGQLPIRLTDFDIAPPDIGGFVRVEDEAVVEVELRLTRQSA
jgi:polyisoprenoid-binding protein YceI